MEIRDKRKQEKKIKQKERIYRDNNIYRVFTNQSAGRKPVQLIKLKAIVLLNFS